MQGCLNHSLSQGHILYRLVHFEPTWFFVSFFSTNVQKRRVIGTKKHGLSHTHQSMFKIRTCPLLLLSHNQNQCLFKCDLQSFSLPYMSSQLSFSSARVKEKLSHDICFGNHIDESGEDFTQNETDWMKEMTELKTMLKCSEQNLSDLVVRCPRLRNLEVLKRVKSNLSFLLERDVTRLSMYKLLKQSKGVFLQVSRKDLIYLFPGDELPKDWYTRLRVYLVNSLKGCKDKDDFEFLAQLLDVNHKLLLKLTDKRTLKMLSAGNKTIILKEKVDYLHSEGISSNDIAYDLSVLLISMENMGRTVEEIKATIGEVTVKLLKSKSHIKSRQKDRVYSNNVLKLLGFKKFSKLKKNFLYNINQTDSVEVLDYLLDKGINKKEIVNNPYVLGHKLSKVKKCFEKYTVTFDTASIKDQRKLLNRMVYDLEYGDDTVQT